MSSVAMRVDAAGMVERQPIGDAAAAVVAGEAERACPSFSMTSIMTLAIERLS